MTALAAVVLAAGEGLRLRPLTEAVPKALCPVGNVPLLDLALERLHRVGLAGPDTVAVNACYLADQVVEAVAGRTHVSVEPDGRPLGTAGGLGYLRDWLDGRGVLVANADAYLVGDDLATLLADWDGRSTRLLGVPPEPGQRPEFGRHRFAGVSLVPWHRVAGLTTADPPTDLVRLVWRPAEAAGELTLVEYAGTYLDTGTPERYLAANLHAAAGGSLVAPDAEVTGTVSHSVIGPGAVVRGAVSGSVVWPGGSVAAGETLRDVIRYGRTGTVGTSSGTNGRARLA
jgi:hypothetical protein